MTNNEAIEKCIKEAKWPEMISSDARIRCVNDSIVIESTPLPMKFIYSWMGFVYIVIIGLSIWRIPEEIVFIAPLALISGIGFCIILKYIETARAKTGPYAIIGSEIRTYDGSVIDAKQISCVYDVYFRAKRGHSSDYYRVVLLSTGVSMYSILWQITIYHRWVSPKFDDIAKRIGVKYEVIRMSGIIQST